MRGNGSTGVKVTVTDWAAARAFARPIRLRVFVEEQGLLADGHIGRMAVLAAARGQGTGGAILEALMSRARARGMTQVVLNAQTHAAPFYARHGFAPCGEAFMEAGIPHVEMRRSLDSAAG